MAIAFERQQKSLIGGNLPQARIDVSAPDLSGLQRLGGALMNAGSEEARRKQQEDREKQDIADTMAGSAAGAEYGQNWIGKDEFGNSVEVQLPEGSAALQRAFLSAFEQSQDAKFRASIETRFADIRAKFTQGEITAEEADALMKSHLEGQLANTPTHRRGAYAEQGQIELLQYSTLMKVQQAAKREQAVAGDLTAVIKSTLNEATSHVAVGGDPKPFLDRIDKAYDTLFGMNRMGEEEVKIAKANVRQLITGQALVDRLRTSIMKGEVSLQDASNFASALSTEDGGAEIVVNKTFEVGPNATPVTVRQGYKSGDVFAKITDPDIRKNMVSTLNEIVSDVTQQAKAQAENNELRDALLFQDSPAGMTTPLPTALQGRTDQLISNILVSENPFDTQKPGETAEAYAARIQKAKNSLFFVLKAGRYSPKPLIQQLIGMASSQDDAQVKMAIQMWQEITTLQTRHGVSAGDLIWRDTVEEDRNFLDALRDAYSMQYPVRDIVNNMREARGSRNFTLEQLITDYNSVVGEGRSFDKDFRAKWLEDFGTPQGDQQAQDSFAKAYRQSMILLRDPEKAFTDAYDRMKKIYQRSDIFVSGVAKTGSAELTNPYGYEGRKDIFGNPAAGTQHDWLEDYIAAEVSLSMGSGRLILPDGLTPDQMNQVFRREATRTVETGRGGSVEMPNYNNPDFLGTRMKLLPVPGSNPDAPEYALRMYDERGHDLGYLKKAGPDGSIQTFTINPHVQRGQEIAMAVHVEKRKSLESAAKASLDKLLLDTVKDLGVEGDPRAYENMPIEEYLGGINPELEKQYRLDKMQIEDGLKKALEQLEQVPGTTIPPAQISPQSLMVPRAAGYDVAAATASAIDSVLPDGTGGTFLMRVAAQESAFGTLNGTYRMIGDKGMMQTNTMSSVQEVKRQIAFGKGRVFDAAQKLRNQLGIDIAAITEEDLDKPLVSMAVARLYIEAMGGSVPQDVEGQAAWWKRYYNTVKGKGTVEEFLISAQKVPDNWRSSYTQQNLVAVPEGAGVSIRYTNADAARNLPVTPSLETKLKSSVLAVFGPGYTVDIFSGGQKKGLSKGIKGTRRHHNGRAADIYVVAPNGKRVTDAGRLMILRNYWLANGYGSAGHFMKGMGLHLDEITQDQLRPGEALSWRY